MPIPNVTKEEFLERLAALLPRGWFSQEAVEEGNTHALLSAIADGDDVVYQQLLLVQQQLSLLTAAGDQLDAVVTDYFGENLPRLTGESDAAYRARAVAQLLLPVGTRPGLEAALGRALNSTPRIMEPGSSRLAGGYASSNWNNVYGPLAWNIAGMWFVASASLDPYEGKITVQQPEPGTDYFMTYPQILKLIATVKPVGSKVWVRVLGPDSTGGVPIADIDANGDPVLWVEPS